MWTEAHGFRGVRLSPSADASGDWFRGPLMDVTTAQAEVPRPMAQHRPMPVECPTLETKIAP